MSSSDLSKLRIDKSAVNYKKAGLGRKIKIALLTVLLILLAFMFQYLWGTKHTVETKTVSVYYPSQAITVLNASGYVTASKKAAVAPKVTGLLVEMKVEEGSRLRKGDTIARLESEDVQASRDQAKASLQAAKENIALAEAEMIDARTNYIRKKELLAESFVTKADFDRAESRLKKAEASLKAAEATFRASMAALKVSETNVQYTYIRAPFDGVVLTKNADVGDMVTPFGAAAGLKAAVVTIADMNSLLVEADVSESNLSKIWIGQPCEIMLDAFPEKRLQGKIHMIVPTADRTKASIMAKVSFSEYHPGILPDMSARVAFLSKEPSEEEKRPVTAVNKNAIFLRDNVNRAFLVRENRAIETTLITGREMGEMIEIKGGLKAGDRVINKPSLKIKNGDAVKVIEQ